MALMQENAGETKDEERRTRNEDVDNVLTYRVSSCRIGVGMSIKEQDLSELREAGLLDAEQCDRIGQHYSRMKGVETSRWASGLLYVFSGLMFLGGIVRLIEAYLTEVPSMAVTLTCSVLIAAAWVLWYERRKKDSVIAQVIAFIGVAFWVASVCWEKYVYGANLFGQDDLLLEFTCCMGFLFIPFFSRQVIMLGLSSIATIWLWCRISDPDVTDSVLSLNREGYLLNSGGMSVLLLMWALLGERWRKSRGMHRDYGWIRFPAYILFFLMLCTEFERSEGSAYDALMICSAVPVLYALIRPAGQKFIPWVLLGVFTGLFMFTGYLYLFGFSKLTVVIAWVAGGALYVAALMGFGVKERRVSWINYGVIVLILIVQDVCVRMFDTLRDTGLALLALGAVLLPLTFFLERMRRSLVRHAKATNPSSPEEIPTTQK